MLRRVIASLSISLVSACTHMPNVASNDTGAPLTLGGHVSVADISEPSNTLTVTINGITQDIEKSGYFSVPVSDEDIYILTVAGPGIYESRHTFSQAELSATSNILSLPDITVVEKKPGRRLLTFGGDAMMGRRYLDPQWNERPLIHDATRVLDMKAVIAEMKPYFEPADFAAVNLETILAETEPSEHAPKSVIFYTHPDITQALEWMGVDYVSLGNNHTYDYLETGIETTLKALDASRLGYSGAGHNEVKALAPYLTDLDGISVAAWGYVGWQGRVKPNQVAELGKGGAAYGSNYNIRLSLDTGAKNGQIDIVQYHGSREYAEGPSKYTETRLKLAVDHGADLVIAHHPHVAQGFELYQDKLIAYSLGNFAFDQFFYSTHAAVALNVWMDGETFYRAEIIPLHVKGYRPLPATNSVRDYVLDRVARLSQDHGTIVSRSGGHGVITAGQTEKPLTSSGKTDILFVGDFESYASFQTPERTWVAENASFNPVRGGHNGRYALELKPNDETKPITFGLKTFARVFPSDKMRWKSVVKVPQNTSITAYIQRRPKGMNRYKALKDAPLEPLGTVEVSKEGWTDIAFDFDAPSWKNHPTRILLKFDKTSEPFKIDDIQLIPVGIPHKDIKR